MSKDPAFLFYSQDFTTGTQFFTDEQVGMYIRLLCAIHQHGHLPEKHMLSICKTRDNDVLEKFKKDDEGKYYNERLEIEINRRKQYSESRRINAQHPKNKSVKKVKARAKHMHEHMEIENEIENTINNDINNSFFPFENFWNEYDKKVGDIAKIKLKWINLTAEEKQKAMEHIPKYKQSQPDKQYRKDPSTYLNNKSFNDEIIFSAKTGINGNNSGYNEKSSSTKQLIGQNGFGSL